MKKIIVLVVVSTFLFTSFSSASYSDQIYNKVSNSTPEEPTTKGLGLVIGHGTRVYQLGGRRPLWFTLIQIYNVENDEVYFTITGLFGNFIKTRLPFGTYLIYVGWWIVDDFTLDISHPIYLSLFDTSAG